MRPIENEQFRLLDSTALASRIDEFFQEDHVGRYGPNVWRGNVTTATAILTTITIQALPEANRRRALLLFFRAQFQASLCAQYAGIQNQLVHLPDQSDAKWQQPRIQVLNAATRQAQIVAARISFECLMEFVYFSEVSNLIPSSKSKSGTFRKWCCSPGNRFGWLVFYLLIVHRYDREHRTPEIHGTSYVAVDALRCESWPRIDSELDITNLMLNIWPSVLQTLNGGSVSGFSFGPREEVLVRGFFNWKNLDLNAFWEANS